MNKGIHHISVCICTFKRPLFLERLLLSLASQVTEDGFTYSAVVVDNDLLETGHEVVEKARTSSLLDISYYVEPERNISNARNRAVANARGEFIAFIDDDEFPDKSWLVSLFRLLSKSGVDGVLGPVIPHFDGKPPNWLVKSGLLDRKCFRTGEIIKNARYTRTGNVLIRKSLFDETGVSFDPKYGLSGGGDGVFFKAMLARGKTFLWCNEAPVREIVPPERQRRSYYLRRAFTRGMTEAWLTPLFSLSTLRSLTAISIYALCLPVCFLLGQHLFMKILVKTCDHLGNVLAHAGIKVVSQRPY